MDGAVLHISAEAPRLDVVAEAEERSPAVESQEVRLQRAFDRCGDDMYRFIILRVRGDRHAADDLLQQTCYEAARHRRIPNGDDAAQAWLFGIAKNLIRRQFRRLKREGRLRRAEALASASRTSSEDSANETGAGAHTDAAPHLLTAIAALSEADQQLLLGLYFEGRSQEELARAIGVSVRAIEGRLYRARQALREALTAQLGDDES